MITYHPDVQVVSGTELVISGVLLDNAGNVLDVTNCDFSWCLLDPDGAPVTAATADVQIAKTAPVNGGITISVSETDMQLLPGRYTDALQVTEGASSDVFWIGNILIAANPLNVANGVVEQPAPPPIAPSPVADMPSGVPPWWAWPPNNVGWW